MEPIRVTACLDYFTPPQLVEWKVTQGRAVANKIMRDAGKHGSRIDDIIKRGAVPDKKDKPEVHMCYLAWTKWKAIYNPDQVVAQTRLYGKIGKWEVTGEPDLMINLDLVDVKATNAIRKKNLIQVNIYEELRRQNGLPPAESLRILRLDRTTGSFEYTNPEAFDPSFVVMFSGLLDAMMYYKENDDDTEL